MRILLWLVALWPVSALAQKTVEPLKISVDRTEFLLGEPVILYVTLTNTGDDAALLPQLLEPEYGMVHFEIAYDDRIDPIRFRPWARKIHVKPTRSLAPGEQIFATVKLFFDGRTWVFPQPGNYTLTVRASQDLCSNPVTITVSEPEDTTLALAWMQSEEVGKFLLFEGGDHLYEAIDILGQSGQGTLPAAYANLALGKNQLEDFANFVEERLRPADPALAVQYLETARTGSLDFYTLAHGHVFLAKAYLALGDSDRANQILDEVNTRVDAQYAELRPFLDALMAEHLAEL